MENLSKLLDMIRDKNLLSYLFTILLTAVVTFFLTEFYYKRDEIKDLKSKNEKNENISIKLSDQKNETKSKNEDLRRKDEDITELKKQVSKAEESKNSLAEELAETKKLIVEKDNLISEQEKTIQRIISCQNDPAILKLINERDKYIDNKGIYTVRNYSSSTRKSEEQNEEEIRKSNLRDLNNQINEMKQASRCIN
ncbi:hypothetical protein [Acinetobacter baumannii]|uniref:hypothetical protein n=1 Tax=Acinetobacter baumannii TaxID=470 RepID=UPI003219D284